MSAIRETVHINQKNAKDTLSALIITIRTLFKLGESEYSVLGSIMKKRMDQSSKDIDLAILASALNTSDDPFIYVANKLSKISKHVKIARSLGIVHFSFPIVSCDGKQQGQLVQVDLMLTNNLKMSQFYHWSPMHLVSKYKGVHRTILLSVIASYKDRKVQKSDDKVQTTWTRYFLERDGLYRGTQTIVSPKTGKMGKTLHTSDKVLISSDPAEILKIVLGHASFKDVESFESLYKSLDKIVGSQKLAGIIRERTKNIFEQAKLPVPTEMESIC